MKNFDWNFPETEADCLDLISKGCRPHGGGTFLIKSSMNVKGLFNLPENLFKSMSDDNGTLRIGASSTYSETVSFVSSIYPDSPVVKALDSAAATPLRNRITIGGSLYALPKWSDIPGPLVLAGAELSFSGDDAIIPVENYIKNKSEYKNKLIKAVHIDKDNLGGRYYRFTITTFDYPFFSLSAVKNKTLKAVITGSSKRLQVFTGSVNEILENAAADLSFSNERDFSGEYLKNRALVELKRLLEGVDNE